jgi:hypothetical protein
MTEPTTPGAQVPADAEKIMEQAQVFASAWSLVGGRFDSGGGFDDAQHAKNELRQMVLELAQRATPTKPTPTVSEAQQAVMRQALDALVLLDDAFCADDYGDREGRIRGRKALTNSRAAVASLRAALSATQEVPDEAA